MATYSFPHTTIAAARIKPLIVRAQTVCGHTPSDCYVLAVVHVGKTAWKQSDCCNSARMVVALIHALALQGACVANSVVMHAYDMCEAFISLQLPMGCPVPLMWLLNEQYLACLAALSAAADIICQCH